MGRKSKQPAADAVTSLFSADNPFRRKPPPAASAAASAAAVPAAPQPHLGLEEVAAAAVPAAKKKKRERREASTNPSPDPDHSDTPPKKKRERERERDVEYPNPNPNLSTDLGDDGEGSQKKRKKRKRDELEELYERKKYGELTVKPAELVAPSVGTKRKAPVASPDKAVTKDSFDDESKLLRTVFIGNLPLKMKGKALMKEFARFGEIESVRIRSVPVIDSKMPRKGAVIKGKINDAVDSMHAYIVFKDEQSASSALSHNMAEVGGNHVRVDMACPPRKKMKGETPLYDRKRTLFVGNLPFDVKDEELYQLFCGPIPSESNVEAVRVIRDPHTSLGKGIAYVLFKSREAASCMVRSRDMKIRDRPLRICHAKQNATPSKPKDTRPKREFQQKWSAPSSSEPASVTGHLSYQGLRASKTNVLKKSGVREMPSFRSASGGQGNHGTKRAADTDLQGRKGKRPAVAARKVKVLNSKRKQESATPENTHRSKKFRKN